MRKDNKSGIKGISFNKEINKWYARVFISGKSKVLGYFKEKEDAIKIRIEEENRLKREGIIL